MAKKRKGQPFYTNGGGVVSGACYGVLRSAFSGRSNSVLDFVAGKLLLADATDWRSSRVSYSVVIPADAPFALWDAKALWTSYEAAQMPGQRDLALVVTSYIKARSPHDGFEQVRAWAVDRLVRKRSLPLTLILHVPATVASANDAHVHLIAGARQLGLSGWGRFAKEVRDDDLKALVEDLAEHRSRWTAAGEAKP